MMTSFPPTHWDTSDEMLRMDAGALWRRLDWAIRQLEAWEVRVPPACRARNALRLLEHLNSANSRGEVARINPEVPTFIAQHMTASDLFLIVYAATLCQYPNHPFTREKLGAIVLGSDQREGRDTTPRDIQFELAIAAQLRLGGVKVFHGEPDVRLQIGYEVWGVAAKRITSLNDDQIRKHIKKAVKQIEDTHLPGIIALNLEGRLDTLKEGADEDQWRAEVDAIFDVIIEYKDLYINNYNVRGLLVYSSLERPLNPTRNGLPGIDLYRPRRFTQFYGYYDDARVFWADWEDKLKRHLLHCYTDRLPDVLGNESLL